MNLFMRFFDIFGRIIFPARLRPTALAARLQQSLDKTVAGLEKGAGKAGAAAERLEGGPLPRTGRVAAFFRWFFHILIVVGILVLLYYVNRYFQLERVLRSSWPALHPYWLSALFLLLYVMMWLAWWIWDLTGPEKLTHEFPDVDQAWKEGLKDVADAGIDLHETPVFLVIGRPLEGEDNVMLAAQFGFKVRDVPRWPEAPLRFSASEHGVFITTGGASVLGRQITLMMEELQEAQARSELRPEAADDVRASAVAPVPVGAAATVGGAEGVATPAPPSAIQEVVDKAQEEGRGPGQLTDEEQRVISLLLAEEQAEKPAVATRRRAFLKNKARVQEEMARLQHVCHLLAHHRRPYCPVNGILVLLPLATTDTDEDAAQAASACELDLTVVQETLNVRCPIFAIGCDAEKMPGFRDFLHRMPVGQRDRRMGQRFPLVPDVEPGALPQLIQNGIGWFCYTFLPALVYNLFRVETPGNGQPHGGEVSEAVVGNMRLYQFLSEMRLRRSRLTRFLTRGMMLDGDAPFFFGGFYVAGTGPDAERDRGFVAGVFQRLPENQNFVAWNKEALDNEAAVGRWTRYGYLLLAAAVAAFVFLVYRLWFR
jgi:hypothetical protein